MAFGLNAIQKSLADAPIWQQMSPPALRRLALTVGLIFAAFGPLQTLMLPLIDNSSWLRLAVITSASAGFAASIILFGKRLLVILILLAVFSSALIGYGTNSKHWHDHFNDRYDFQNSSEVTLTTDDVDWQKQQRKLIGMTGIIFVTIGYAFFISVVSKEIKNRGRLEKEFEIARDIQKSLLPAAAFANEWCEVVGSTVPATEIGGDYFDVVKLSEDEVLVFVADVSGHGVGAGLIAAMLKSALYAQLESRPSLPALLEKMNRTIFQLSDKQMFVTVACLNLDWRSRTAHLATAGHLPILFYSAADNFLKLIRTPALSLGLREGVRFDDTKVAISPGDRFLLYTDGLIEAHRRDGEQFGEERLQQTWKTLIASVDVSSNEQLLKAVRAFTGQNTMPDDATIVNVRLF